MRRRGTGRAIACGHGGLVAAVAMLAPACVEEVVLQDEYAQGSALLFPVDEKGWWLYQVSTPDRTYWKVVVSDGIAKPIPAQDAMGYELLSLRDTKTGRRWQSLEGGTIRRHRDEWSFPDDPSINYVDHFCPPKLRVADAPPDASWEEHHAVTTLSPCTTMASEAGACQQGDATWEQCKQVPVDPETCEVVEVPDGCQVTQKRVTKSWHVVSVGEPYAHAPADVAMPDGANPGVWRELHPLVLENTETNDDPSDPSTEVSRFKWERGIGKVHEDGGIDEEEWLIDFCIVSEDPSCDRSLDVLRSWVGDGP